MTLIEAAGEGHVDIVKLLIEDGADINIMELHGLTALMIATK